MELPIILNISRNTLNIKRQTKSRKLITRSQPFYKLEPIKIYHLSPAVFFHFQFSSICEFIALLENLFKPNDDCQENPSPLKPAFRNEFYYSKRFRIHFSDFIKGAEKLTLDAFPREKKKQIAFNLPNSKVKRILPIPSQCKNNFSN